MLAFARCKNVRFYLLCIHIDIFMHCALYVFYEANKDDYCYECVIVYSLLFVKVSDT